MGSMSLRFNSSRLIIGALLAFASVVVSDAQVRGPNRNATSGTAAPDDPDGFLKTDLFQQRQNESVIVSSTVNAEHLLAAANDYRTIDVGEDFGLGESNEGFVDRLVHARGDAPLPELLAEFGIDVELRVQCGAEDRGGKEITGNLPRAGFGATVKAGDDGLTIVRVDEGGAAQSAGLAAGDQLLAVDGLRLDAAGFEARLKRAQAGECWQVHAFRRDELHQFEVELAPAEANTFVLKLADNPGELCRGWLGLE